MAHECPVCSCTCHCGGDIDDINWGLPDAYCKCCGDLEDEDEEEYCDDCGWNTYDCQCHCHCLQNIKKED